MGSRQFQPPQHNNAQRSIKHFLRVKQQTLGQTMRGGWLWYRGKTQNAQIGMGICTVLLMLSFVTCTSCAAVADRASTSALLTPTATPHQAAITTSAITTTVMPRVDVTIAPTERPTASMPTKIHPTPISTPKLRPTATPTLKPRPTARPTLKPRPTATPIPKPRPTARPTPTSPPRLTITFTCASAVDYSYGRVCVHTPAGAALTIVVRYCSGYKAVSHSLQGTVYANSGGNYEWDWKPETKCRGAATAYVNASLNGRNASNADGFTVR